MGRGVDLHRLDRDVKRFLIQFLLARIAVRAAFATRRIRVLLDVLAMFSSAFAAAMILSLSSDTGGVGAVASMAAKESRSFHPFESFGSFAGTGVNSINN